MAQSHEQTKVLIVGAGPGGLALAQILRCKGISYEIFERDDGFGTRNQGWCVALVESIPDLKELLPKDLDDLKTVSVNSNIGVEDKIAFVNPKDANPLMTLGDTQENLQLIRVNRERLRGLLWQHLKVQTGKQFVRYEQDEDGVTVHFKDGSSARGAILVGADGANSYVRNQLLDNPGMISSRLIPLIGECELPRHIYEPLHTRGSAAVITASTEARVMLGTKSVTPDRSSAIYYWAVCFLSSDPDKDSAWTMTATKEEMYDKAVTLTTGWSPTLTEIIRYTGVNGMRTPFKFREFVPPAHLPSGRVTLIGDAAHTMIPFRLSGANTALQDACDLARAVESGIEAGNDFDKILRGWEKTLLPRGREMVLNSRAVGETPEFVDAIDIVKKGRIPAK